MTDLATFPSGWFSARESICDRDDQYGLQHLGGYGGFAVTERGYWFAASGFNLPAAPVTLTLFSSSGFDTLAGTGCRTARVYGWNNSGARIYEDFNMNGVAGSVGARNDWWRIRAIVCRTFGTSGGLNAGYITAQSGGVTYEYCQTGVGMSHSAKWYVEAGKKLKVYGMIYGSNGGLASQYIRSNYDPIGKAILPSNQYVWWALLYGTGYQIDLTVPLTFPAGTDVLWTNVSTAGSYGACVVKALLMDA